MTTSPDTPYREDDNFVELPEHDKQRMARLYEEVQGRLIEISLIVARNLSMVITERTVVMLRPISIKADTESASVSRKVEVHCTQLPDGNWQCGCYDYEAGTCGPC